MPKRTGNEKMVNREARAQMAEAVRHFASGRITNYEFEAKLPYKTDDPAIREIWFGAIWFLYDDVEEHRLAGAHALPKEVKRSVAQCILFLKSDLEYEWPEQHAVTNKSWLLFILKALVLVLTLFGLYWYGGARLFFTVWFGGLLIFYLKPRLFIQRDVYMPKEDEFWPFFRKENLKTALGKPIYLSGPKQSCI